MKWTNRCKELEVRERQLHDSLEPHLKQVLQGKTPNCFQEMPDDFGYPDDKLTSWCEAFAMVFNRQVGYTNREFFPRTLKGRYTTWTQPWNLQGVKPWDLQTGGDYCTSVGFNGTLGSSERLRIALGGWNGCLYRLVPYKLEWGFHGWRGRQKRMTWRMCTSNMECALATETCCAWRCGTPKRKG